MISRTGYYTHDIDPMAFSILGLPFPWYWLAYVFGFFFVYLMSRSVIKKNLTPLPLHTLNDYAISCWIAIILGGRLGYVLIYYPSFYWNHPQEIHRIWMGGMSFHGALIAGFLALLCVARHHRHSPYYMADLIALLVPIALGVGRIANYVGGELVGTPTTLPWAVIFPHYDALPRHPSQLYQAASEGFLLGALLWSQRRLLHSFPSRLTALFLIGYGSLRSLVELVRQPDPQIGYLFAFFTTGHLLCFLMIIIGIIVLFTTQPPPSKLKESSPTTT